MNLYFKLLGESMRKIWLRFSDPWWKNVTPLGGFTWNVPYRKWIFPHYTMAKTADLYMLNECNGHFPEYFSWFPDSKPEGQRKWPEKWVFPIFPENKTDA
jgi:hypothetical protein